MIITATGYYVLTCVVRARVMGKFLFNDLPVMMCIPKLAYWELLICHGVVTQVMRRKVYRYLYEDTPGAAVVGKKMGTASASNFIKIRR